MRVIHSIKDFQQWRKQVSLQVGFVPTMGALHAGHGELLKFCRNENDISVLSIFVNPTQFNDKTDFVKYPKTWDEDLQVAQKHHVDVVFAPEYSEMYPDQYAYKLSESHLSQQLCGRHRPGHFDGVLTVVMKLLQIVKPHKAYFGEKDFQQLSLIKGMVQAFFLDVQIRPIATVREEDGLAMSSRNTRLSSEGRKKAGQINHLLASANQLEDARESLQNLGFHVDYIEQIANRRFVAATIDGVRLIDNVEI